MGMTSVTILLLLGAHCHKLADVHLGSVVNYFLEDTKQERELNQQYHAELQKVVRVGQFSLSSCLMLTVQRNK